MKLGTTTMALVFQLFCYHVRMANASYTIDARDINSMLFLRAWAHNLLPFTGVSKETLHHQGCLHSVSSKVQFDDSIDSKSFKVNIRIHPSTSF